jgi:hypothetical protein
MKNSKLFHVLGAFLLSRLSLFLGFWLSQLPGLAPRIKAGLEVVLMGQDLTGSRFAFSPFRFNPFENSWLDLSASWDGFWYLMLAKEGYHYDGSTLHQTVAHYPLFSWVSGALTRLFSAQALDADYLLCGVILNHAVFLLGLWMLFEIVCHFSSARIAQRAVWALAFFPASIAFSVYLTESFYFFLSVGFFWLLIQEAPFLAGGFGLLAQLTRVQGLTMVFSYGVSLWERRHEKNQAWLRWVPQLGLILGFFLVPLYFGMYLQRPWLYFELQNSFVSDRTLKLFFVCLASLAFVAIGTRAAFLKRYFTLQTLYTVAGIVLLLCYSYYGLSRTGLFPQLGWVERIYPTDYRVGLPMTFFAFVLLWRYGHQLPKPYWVYAALNLLPLIFPNDFLSNARYLSVLFPIFWLLGICISQRSLLLQRIFWGLYGFIFVGYSVLYCSYNWLLLF